MPSGKQSERLPATGIVFRETTTDYENSCHHHRQGPHHQIIGRRPRHTIFVPVD